MMHWAALKEYSLSPCKVMELTHWLVLHCSTGLEMCEARSYSHTVHATSKQTCSFTWDNRNDFYIKNCTVLADF